MSDDEVVSVAGEIDSALARADLARVLADAGFAAEAGVYAMRLRLAGERVEFTRDEVGYILCSGFEAPDPGRCFLNSRPLSAASDCVTASRSMRAMISSTTCITTGRSTRTTTAVNND